MLAVVWGKSGILFSENFDDGDVFSSGKWTKSSDEKYAGQPVMVKGPDKAAKGFSGDKGLSLTQEMKFYGKDKEDKIVGYLALYQQLGGTVDDAVLASLGAPASA